jgi:hypothetical protein
MNGYGPGTKLRHQGISIAGDGDIGGRLLERLDDFCSDWYELFNGVGRIAFPTGLALGSALAFFHHSANPTRRIFVRHRCASC